MDNFIKSILKTAVYFLDQTDRFAGDVRDRVSDTVDRAANRVSDRVSALRDQTEELYEGENHTMRNVLTFAAGVAVGVGAGMLLAPASGDEIRGSIGNKVQDIGDRVRSRFSSASQTRRSATGTEGI
jgi:gas vesicle protein